ncbi:multidrug ABC transporter ATP-binding protein [Clavibacter michiganensis]|nr:ABC transporter ATP-binding protein [Clavibacter michiganensis]PPF63799.1 multidrug ABC transporter ATP-binding protein [Clavibacter michiganensis]
MTSGAIASPSELAIETTALTKRFGRQTVVDDLALSVPRGSVFGFLGPNGSGKTTTIRMLLGLAQASAGDISLLGERMPQRLAAVLPQVGALIEGPGFYPFLSGAANLRRLDSADGFAPSRPRSDRVARALERVGLTHAADKKVKAYSLGMKQRLGIANALLAPRDLIVLDEPTNGLDPQGTREVRSLIRSLADEGTTVFVSSHLLAEIEQMCTHAAVMRAGRLMAQGTLDELRSAGTTRVSVITPDAEAAARVLLALGLDTGHPDASGPVAGSAVGPASTALPGTVVSATLPEAVAPEDIVAALVAAQVRVRGFSVDHASLEDLFVALTGEGFDVVQ